MLKKPGKKKRMIGTLLVALGTVTTLVIAGGVGVATADTLDGSRDGYLLADSAYGQGKCTVSQKLIANDPDAENTAFSYKITPETTGAPLPGGVSTFSLKKNESKDLNFSFTEEGTYIYKLSCTGFDSGKYTKDTAEYTIKAFVYSNNGTKGTEIIISDSNGNKREEAAFKHVKLGDSDDPEVDPIIAVDPPVKKNITGTPANKDEFQFRLRAEEAGNPMPEGSSGGEKIMSIYGAGEKEFGTWEYRVTGTYNYDISEIDTGNPDYKYDTKMFTITDVVTLNNGELNVDRTIVDSNGNRVASTIITQESSGERSGNVEFTNEYVGGGGSSTESQNPTNGTRNNPGGSNDDGSKKDRLSRVNTGDSNRMIVFIVLGAAAAGVILIVLLSKKRKREEE